MPQPPECWDYRQVLGSQVCAPISGLILLHFCHYEIHTNSEIKTQDQNRVKMSAIDSLGQLMLFC
jgi:hypothetical protein